MVTYFPKPLNNQVAAISDSLKRTQNGLGIGASGDTHDAIGSGQFVYVRDHSSLTEGLYKAKAAIAQDGALSTSNLTADDSGGLNDLQSQITSLSSKLIKHRTVSRSITCGNAIVHFPGSGTANLGLGQANIIGDLPTGCTFIALIPSQASRADGIDIAFEIVPDNARSTIRIYGTPNETYTAYAEMLYI